MLAHKTKTPLVKPKQGASKSTNDLEPNVQLDNPSLVAKRRRLSGPLGGYNHRHFSTERLARSSIPSLRLWHLRWHALGREKSRTNLGSIRGNEWESLI